MLDTCVKTHRDGIWVSTSREQDIVQRLNQQLIAAGFTGLVWRDGNNFGYPYIYNRGVKQVNCRLVDSVFFTDPEVWSNNLSILVTDNIPLQPLSGQLLNVLPEFWTIWRFDPEYIDRSATHGFNCFMNRSRGDRSMIFYELLKRNILKQGLVSFNSSTEEYEKQYIDAELYQYSQQHKTGSSLVPYNTVETHGSLEQCIIDSNVSLVVETYISDSHIVFSEKIFRVLQMPRPWLLYCSPKSIEYLKQYGFDVLEDYVDHSYDQILENGHRLLNIINQLETFINRKYTKSEYIRFEKAATHNQNLLLKFAQEWPNKFNSILEKIKQL
jgi:hypothetical protein